MLTRTRNEDSSLNNHFGEHFMIDGYKCSQRHLDDRELVLGCLHDLPPKLRMKALAAPEVYFAQGGSVKDPGGWTGFIVIEESHISIHTFPIFRFVSIDVYTCQNGLDISAIKDYFREKFLIEVFETNFIRRGIQFSALAFPQSSETCPEQGSSNHVSW